MKSKKLVAAFVVGGFLLVTTVLFTNMTDGDSSASLCAASPSCITLLGAMNAGQAIDLSESSSSNPIQPLTPAMMLEMAAKRFGYGISPVERDFVPDKMTQNRLAELAWVLSEQLQGRLGFNAAYGPTLDQMIHAMNGAQRAALEARIAGDLGLASYSFPPETVAAFARPSDGAFSFANYEPYNVMAEMARLRSVIRAFDGNRELEAKRIRTMSSGAAEESGRAQVVLESIFGSQYRDSSGVRDRQINFRSVAQEFWFNHFNIDYDKSSHSAFGNVSYEENIRKLSFQSFESMLKMVIKSPAMQFYLDNNVNRFEPAPINAPSNQNLGREVLELHTFGIGPRTATTQLSSPYNQVDVEVASTILTGHNVLNGTSGGVFVYGYSFVPTKSFNGSYVQTFWTNRTAANRPLFFTQQQLATLDSTPLASRLDHLLSLLADHPQTKLNLCHKLASHFTYPGDLGAARQRCLAVYNQAGTKGNLPAMYLAIVSNGNFWRRVNFSAKLTNPVETVLSNIRATGVERGSFANAGVVDGAKVMNFARFVSEKIGEFGLHYKYYGDPTGYNQNGAAWLSQGYLITYARFAFELANLDRIFQIQTVERKLTAVPTFSQEISNLATAPGDIRALTVQALYGNVQQRAQSNWFGQYRGVYLKNIVNQGINDSAFAANLDQVRNETGKLAPSVHDTAVSFMKTNQSNIRR